MPLSLALGLALLAPAKNDYYVNHRAPLRPSPFQKLPPGAVRANGWLLWQLELQKEGFSGRLAEISSFLNTQDNAWLGNTTNPRAGWEEAPYWLRGQVGLAYVLDDKKLKSECQKWIEGILSSQKPDGWFGPEGNRTTRHGTPDLWPNMLAQQALQTYFEATGDKRVLNLFKNYYGWLTALPEEQTVDPKHYWHFYRVGDQISSLIWYYNQTGDPQTLPLAEKMHRRSAKWVDRIVNRHGVNFAQGFREPALYGVFSKNLAHLEATERNLADYMGQWGLPGGMYAADENARTGKDDPRQATESCSVAEMMTSYEMLLRSYGDAKWADKCEEVAFNWFPTTMTADLKALRYLTCANMPISDAAGHSPGIENGGPMFLFDPRDHRCCQHNIGMAWPMFTENLWMATEGNGLAAVMYSPSTVTAKVGDGTIVKIEERTDYPFEHTVRFLLSVSKPVKFPLALRVPDWCLKPSALINGKPIALPTAKGFARIDRTWRNSDRLEIRFLAATEIEAWPKFANTLTVRRGPLWYALPVKEIVEKTRPTDAWPAYQLFPASEWNYGLDSNLEIGLRAGPGAAQPWILNAAPVAVQLKARRIPEWTTDIYGLAAPLQKSPALSNEPLETITLIPMGAARLRTTVFPTVSPTGTRWTKPKQAARPIPARYSHRNWWDTESALSDKLTPENSGDEAIPRFTWWDHKGTEEWVQYDFAETRTFQKCRVYWFDDDGKGGCRLPESWKVQVDVAGKWVDVEPIGSYSLVKNGWSEVTFKPMGGTKIRLVAKLQTGFSSGVLEWECN